MTWSFARPRYTYALAALILLVIEAMIALFVKDGFVRPYVGDVLAVALVYAILRAATPLGTRLAIAAALGVATAIEVAQRFHILDALGLGDNQIARIVLGGAFDPMDFVAYASGAILVAGAEATTGRGR